MICLINVNLKKKKIIWKGKRNSSYVKKINRTHLSNVVFAKSQVSGFQDWMKLLNSFSELDSLFILSLDILEYYISYS